MKKVLFSFFAVLLLVAGTALAHGGQYAKSDVAAIQAQAVDDQRVILEGRFVRLLGHEDYTFQDSTGEITMEVDDDISYGFGEILNVEFRVYGKVDVDHNGIEVEAKRLERL